MPCRGHGSLGGRQYRGQCFDGDATNVRCWCPRCSGSPAGTSRTVLGRVRRLTFYLTKLIAYPIVVVSELHGRGVDLAGGIHGEVVGVTPGPLPDLTRRLVAGAGGVDL